MENIIDLGSNSEWSKPFISDYLYIDSVEGCGWGVYTSDFIKKSTMIEVAPVLVFPFDDVFKKYKIVNYCVLWQENPIGQKNIAIPFGWTMFYNHSDNNSCNFANNYAEDLLGIISNRDINPNEQVTVSYGPNWFSDRDIIKLDI